MFTVRERVPGRRSDGAEKRIEGRGTPSQRSPADWGRGRRSGEAARGAALCSVHERGCRSGARAVPFDRLRANGCRARWTHTHGDRSGVEVRVGESHPNLPQQTGEGAGGPEKLQEVQLCVRSMSVGAGAGPGRCPSTGSGRTGVERDGRTQTVTGAVSKCGLGNPIPTLRGTRGRLLRQAQDGVWRSRLGKRLGEWFDRHRANEVGSW